MKPIRALLLFLFLPLCVFAGEKKVNITAVFDSYGDSVAADLWAQVISETRGLLNEEYNIEFSETYIAVETKGKKRRYVDKINEELQKADVDIIITMGALVSDAASKVEKPSKNIIAPIVIDAKLQGFPENKSKSGTIFSGRNNFTYLTSYQTVQRDLGAFYEMLGFKSLLVIVNKNITSASFFQRLRKYSEKNSIFSINIAAIEDESDIEKLDLSVADAVYFTPLGVAEETKQILIDKINKAGIPSFSMYGKSDVESGVLMAATDNDNNARLARRIALSVQSILSGEEAAYLSTDFRKEFELVINMKTAAEIGFYPNWELLAEAELINADRGRNFPDMSMRNLVDLAIKNNLSLESAGIGLKMGEENVSSAAAKLRPKVGLGLTEVRLDEEHVSPFQYQNETRAGISIEQVVFSEMAWAGYSTEKLLQKARSEEYKSYKKDIVYQAGKLYLTLLQIDSLKKIALGNLKITKNNLRLARLRESVGYSGRADIYRWQSEVNNDRKELAQIISAYKQMLIKLNAVIGADQEKEYNLQEPDKDGSFPLLCNGKILKYIENPRSFAVFRDFAVEQGLESSNKVRQIENTVAALKKGLLAVKADRYIPNIGIKGEVSELLDYSGAGGQMLLGKDETSWNLGLSVSWDLYSGGSKSADIRRGEFRLHKTMVDLKAFKEEKSAQIRAALQKISGSYPAIKFSKDSALAAAKNLELVQDAYAKGAVSVTELIDSQNAAFVAEQAVVKSKYDFLLDYLDYQRAVGVFSMHFSKADENSWFVRLNSFFKKRGIDIRR